MLKTGPHVEATRTRMGYTIGTLGSSTFSLPPNLDRQKQEGALAAACMAVGWVGAASASFFVPEDTKERAFLFLHKAASLVHES